MSTKEQLIPRFIGLVAKGSRLAMTTDNTTLLDAMVKGVLVSYAAADKEVLDNLLSVIDTFISTMEAKVPVVAVKEPHVIKTGMEHFHSLEGGLRRGDLHAFVGMNYRQKVTPEQIGIYAAPDNLHRRSQTGPRAIGPKIQSREIPGAKAKARLTIHVLDMMGSGQLWAYSVASMFKDIGGFDIIDWSEMCPSVELNMIEGAMRVLEKQTGNNQLRHHLVICSINAGNEIYRVQDNIRQQVWETRHQSSNVAELDPAMIFRSPVDCIDYIKAPVDTAQVAIATLNQYAEAMEAGTKLRNGVEKDADTKLSFGPEMEKVAKQSYLNPVCKCDPDRVRHPLSFLGAVCGQCQSTITLPPEEVIMPVSATWVRGEGKAISDETANPFPGHRTFQPSENELRWRQEHDRRVRAEVRVRELEAEKANAVAAVEETRKAAKKRHYDLVSSLVNEIEGTTMTNKSKAKLLALVAEKIVLLDNNQIIFKK